MFHRLKCEKDFPMRAPLKTVFGEPSWILRSDRVELAVTRLGGHVGPVTFDRHGKAVQPFHIGPAWKQKTDPKLLPVLKVLRGDFFCLPFGGNPRPYRGERHLPHGETANARWRFISRNSSNGEHHLTLRMRLGVRRGLVTKRVLLRDGEDVVYQEHVVEGMRGLNCPGHHPNLEFRSTGNIAVSPFLWGSTNPGLPEKPENGTYASLKTGVVFRKLGKLPLFYGGESDLSVYPNRRGFTDVLQIVADPKRDVAWNTVTFPQEGWLYFALRDPRVLRQTVMWFSNGGRYAAPWLGRHFNVLGLEDVTCYFAEGLPLSAQANPWSRRGTPTAMRFDAAKPTSIRYIMGVARIPGGFTRVKDVRFEENHVVFQGDRGHARARVDWSFLKTRR